MKRPRLRTSLIVVAWIATAVVAMAASVGAARWWTTEHAALPGLRGCMTIQKYSAITECISERYDAAVEDDGIVATTAKLDEMTAGRIRHETACHQAMHDMAPKLLADGLDPLELDLEVDAERTGCAYGLQHGFLEATIDDDPEVYEALVERTCTLTAGIPSEQTNCFHGVGHAYLYSSKQVPVASKRCHETSSHWAGIQACLDGLYMDKAQNVSADVKPLEAIRQVCVEAPSRDRPTCYAQAGLVLARYDWKSFRDVIQFCNSKVPDGIARYLCVGLTSFGVPFEELEFCATLSHLSEQYCASSATFQAVELHERSEVIEACEPVAAIHWGCGAGLGSRRLSQIKSADEWQEALEICDEMDGTMKAGCVAQISGCWPVEVSSQPHNPARCPEGTVPDEYWPREGGKRVTSMHVEELETKYAWP